MSAFLEEAGFVVRRRVATQEIIDEGGVNLSDADLIHKQSLLEFQ